MQARREGTMEGREALCQWRARRGRQRDEEGHAERDLAAAAAGSAAEAEVERRVKG